MIIDIKPHKNSNLDCLEQSIATLAIWYGRSYELMFATKWKFYYDREPENKLLKMNVKSGDFSAQYLSEFHGIEVKVDDVHTIEHCLERTALGEPFGVCVKANGIPWDDRYGDDNHKGKHYFIVTGFDERAGLVYCTDTYYNVYEQPCSIEVLKKALTLIYSFTLNYDFSTPSLKDFLTIAITDTISSDSIEQIRNLADDFDRMDYSDVEQELAAGPQDPWVTPIFTNMHHVSRAHYHYSLALRSIGEAHAEDAVIAKGFIQWFEGIHSKFMASTRLLFKIITITGRTDFETNKDMLVQILRETAVAEEQALSHAIRYCKGDHSFKLEEGLMEHPEFTVESFQQVDISGFYNNRGIAGASKEADLTGTGLYFLPDLFPKSDMWENHNISFRSPLIGNSMYDNISCVGQSIDLPKGDYRYVTILGCCEHGSFIEKAYLVSDDNESYKQVLALSEWNSETPKFNDRIFWQATRTSSVVDLGPSERDPHHLFTNVLPIPQGIGCKQLKLPICPNMHIFAISLVV